MPRRNQILPRKLHPMVRARVAEGENQSANKTDVVVSTDLPEGNPRPFCYIFIKTVNATDVAIPSLLIVIAEEEVNTDAMADDAKKEDVDFQQ